MSKKFTDSRLREIALMTSKGMPVDQMATITGLPPKSVANIVWIYKWSPEMVDEMTERSRTRGPRGEGARSRLRKYFAMHPEQRPALQQMPSDHAEPVDVHVDDRNAHARIDHLHDRIGDIWNFASDINERLIKIEQRDVPDGVGDQLTSLAGRVDELERRVAVMHRDVAGLKQASGPEVLPVTLDRLAKCEKALERIDRDQLGQDFRQQDLRNHCESNDKVLSTINKELSKQNDRIGLLSTQFDEHYSGNMKFADSTLERLTACEKRIARLQEILKAVFRVLPAEYA